MIQITYPNEGVYAGGKARFEVIDDKDGHICSCRYATDLEAILWELKCSIDRMEQALLNKKGD